MCDLNLWFRLLLLFFLSGRMFVGCNCKAEFNQMDTVTTLIHAINQLPQAGNCVEVVVFPPTVFLAACVDAADNHGIGAQNIYEAVGPTKGATGR